MNAAKAEDFMLSQVIGACPVAIFVLNDQHVITHWNRACESLTGLSAEAMVGTRDGWRAFYDEPRPMLANLMLDGASEDVVRTLYGPQIRASSVVIGGWEGTSYWNRRQVWLSFTVAPLLSLDGSVTGALETVRLSY